MSTRRKPLRIDGRMWRWRHLTGSFFGKLKELKRIAMRSDKTDGSLLAAICLAVAAISSRWFSAELGCSTCSRFLMAKSLLAPCTVAEGAVI